MSIFKRYINIIKTEKSIFCLLTGMLLFGFLFGLIFPGVGEKFIFNINSINFYINALSTGDGVGLVIFSRFFAYLFCLFILVICTRAILLIIVACIVVFYNAYLLGAILQALISNFKFNGLVLYILSILIQGLSAIVGYVVYALTIFYADKKHKSCISKKHNLRLKAFFIALILLIGALILTLIAVFCLLRPLNLAF